MPSSPSVLVHLCSADDWRLARELGEHRPDSLDAAGFVHLPANRLYAGRADLVLLRIDPARLSSEVLWEPAVATDPDSMLFPHLYGPLPAAAVISVTSYRPDANGRFAPPGDQVAT